MFVCIIMCFVLSACEVAKLLSKLLKKKLKNGLGLDSEAGMLGVYLAERRRCAKN